MSMTVATLASYGGIYLGDDDGTGGVLSAVDIANHAGEFFTSCRKWSWLGRRVAYLDLRGSIAITAGTSNGDADTLTETGAFADYTFVPGDTVKIVSGDVPVDVVMYPGTKQVAGKIDDDNIVLVEPLASGRPLGNIVANLEPSTAELPGDFRSMKPYMSVTDSDVLISGIELISLGRLNSIRTNLAAVSASGPYWGTAVAVSTPRVQRGTKAGNKVWFYDPPQYVLEHHPRVNVTRSEAITLTYYAGWTRVTSDNDYIDIPEYMEGLFIQLYKAFVKGYLEDDEATMEQRLEAWVSSALYKAMARRDSAIQPARGVTRGGGAQRGRSTAGLVPYHPYPLH